MLGGYLNAAPKLYTNGSDVCNYLNKNVSTFTFCCSQRLKCLPGNSTDFISQNTTAEQQAELRRKSFHTRVLTASLSIEMTLMEG